MCACSPTLHSSRNFKYSSYNAPWANLVRQCFDDHYHSRAESPVWQLRRSVLQADNLSVTDVKA